MSDVKPYVDPNGPDFYAPPALRERATREQPGVTPEPAAEWRPRLSDGPPLQPLDKPQRRDEVFAKAVAQALQEAMEPGPVEAPSVLRGALGQRAPFSLVVRFSIAVAASIALILVMAIPAPQSSGEAAQARDTGRQDARKPEQDDALYRQFLNWQKSTDANRWNAIRSD